MVTAPHRLATGSGWGGPERPLSGGQSASTKDRLWPVPPVTVGKPGLQQLQPGGDWMQVQL